MAIFKCKMCGGDLNISADSNIVECEYCGTTQTVPSADTEKKMTLFNRANRLRLNSEFDKAAVLYEQIVAEFPEEAEAYWGLCLCNYGIEYVDDPATGKKIPTCHRASFQKLSEDENYQLAMEYSDAIAQRVYRTEAREIDRINEEILSVSKNEKPYDVFICYKETDDVGGRTPDSVMAQEVYDALTDKGYKVFFSRITLEDKLGLQYEPYIFAALNSAKVMLAFGTKYEYFHAVWVKNEWNRFLKLAAKDKTKKLIPVYKDMDPYDLPDEFKALQAQDMGKLGAVQDLVRGVGKLLPDMAVNSHAKSAPSSTAGLLKRAFLFLEDGKWQEADSYCEKVLDIDPECAEAYLGKLMAELHVYRREQLSETAEPFDQNDNCKKASRFDAKLAKEFADVNSYINNRNIERAEEQRKERLYQDAQRAKSDARFKEAAEIYGSIPGYKNADVLAKECIEQEKEKLYHKARLAEAGMRFMEAMEYYRELSGYKDVDALAKGCAEKAEEQRKETLYQKARRAEAETRFMTALSLFAQIPGYKDADDHARLCPEKAQEKQNEEVYQEAMKKAALDYELGYRKAEELFRSISGYKDSDGKADECRKKIEELRTNQGQSVSDSFETVEEERERYIAADNEKKIRRIADLQQEKTSLETKLLSLKGLFKAGRRKEVEARIAEIDYQLKQ